MLYNVVEPNLVFSYGAREEDKAGRRIHVFFFHLMNFLTGSYIGRSSKLKTIKRAVIRRSHSLDEDERERTGKKKRGKERKEKAERWKHKKCQRITSNFQWIRRNGVLRLQADFYAMMEFDRYRPFRNMCTGTSSGHIQRFSAHSDSLVSSRAKIELFRRATFSLSPSFSSTPVFARAL